MSRTATLLVLLGLVACGVAARPIPPPAPQKILIANTVQDSAVVCFTPTAWMVLERYGQTEELCIGTVGEWRAWALRQRSAN